MKVLLLPTSGFSQGSMYPFKHYADELKTRYKIETTEIVSDDLKEKFNLSKTLTVTLFFSLYLGILARKACSTSQLRQIVKRNRRNSFYLTISTEMKVDFGQSCHISTSILSSIYTAT